MNSNHSENNNNDNTNLIEINQDQLIYSLNLQEKTAKIIKNNDTIANVLIPRSITYKSQDFIVKYISEGSFMNSKSIRTIQFAPDSEVETIGKNAFKNTYITSLFLPASISRLEDGWCSGMINLSNVMIDHKNRFYKNFEGNKDLIIGKSDIKSDIYDILVFANRNILFVEIPSNIKIIASNCFEHSIIDYFFIPPHITKICEGAFSNCSITKNFEIPSNSELRIIESNAFYGCSVESITFPSTVCELKDGWCSFALQLKHVKIDPNNRYYKNCEENEKLIVGKSDKSNVLVFACRDIQTATIPSSVEIIAPFAFQESQIKSVIIPPSVTTICEFAFAYCCELNHVQFLSGSNLKKIEQYAFNQTAIESFSLPPQVKRICKGCFGGCTSLQKFDIPQNSELEVIEESAFANSLIENLSIPRNVFELQKNWCENMPELKTLTIDQNNCYFKNYEDDKIVVGKSDKNKNEYDVLVFVSSDIENFTIPSNIKIIASFAFQYCQIESIFIPPQVTRIEEQAFLQCNKLKKVEFSPDSELRMIENSAFSKTKIESISIPKKVNRIGSEVFYFCECLKHVEIPPDSELQSFESLFLTGSSVESITIPQSVCRLEERWCYAADYLTNVKIHPDNRYFKNYEENEKLIVGKSDVNSDEYDVLVFASRDIKTVVIPPNIKIIANYAFSNTNIEKIFIPSKVTHICRGSFELCENLKFIEFSQESELRVIERDAFQNTKIKSIVIPRYVEILDVDAFLFCDDLNIIEFDENSELVKNLLIMLADLHVKIAMIPV